MKLINLNFRTSMIRACCLLLAYATLSGCAVGTVAQQGGKTAAERVRDSQTEKHLNELCDPHSLNYLFDQHEVRWHHVDPSRVGPRYSDYKKPLGKHP